LSDNVVISNLQQILQKTRLKLILRQRTTTQFTVHVHHTPNELKLVHGFNQVIGSNLVDEFIDARFQLCTDVL